MNAAANRVKIAAVVAGLIFWGLTVTACGDDLGSSPQSVITTTATVNPYSLPPTARFDSFDMPDGQRVEVSFEVTDRHGLGVRRSAQQDTIALLKHIRAAYPQVQFVSIAGYATMKDDYGNTGRQAVLAASYERATIDRINFSGIDRSTIWEIRDGGGGLRSDFG